jgi:phage-related protein
MTIALTLRRASGNFQTSGKLTGLALLLGKAAHLLGKAENRVSATALAAEQSDRRALFCARRGRMLVPHGFIKKIRRTPPDDPALAYRRNREFET